MKGLKEKYNKDTRKRLTWISNQTRLDNTIHKNKENKMKEKKAFTKDTEGQECC